VGKEGRVPSCEDTRPVEVIQVPILGGAGGGAKAVRATENADSVTVVRDLGLIGSAETCAPEAVVQILVAGLVVGVDPLDLTREVPSLEGRAATDGSQRLLEVFANHLRVIDERLRRGRLRRQG